MTKNILIIGGTRYFGKMLVQHLLDAGNRVTIATRGQTPDQFGDKVRRKMVDRRDRAAMHAAFEEECYDLIYDQMAYSPIDAQISVEVFAGKVTRYVMASTIEVYNQSQSNPEGGFDEADFNAQTHPYELDFPWHEAHLADVLYGEGKRQAEAYFAQNAPFDVVCVRIAHVVSKVDDFTKRIDFYQERMANSQPIYHSQNPRKTAFITPQLLVQFMAWIGEAEVVGAVNASAGELDVFDLVAHVAVGTPHRPRFCPTTTRVGPNLASPFDYPHPFFINTDFARRSGFQFETLQQDLSGFAAILPTKKWEH